MTGTEIERLLRYVALPPLKLGLRERCLKVRRSDPIAAAVAAEEPAPVDARAGQHAVEVAGTAARAARLGRAVSIAEIRAALTRTRSGWCRRGDSFGFIPLRYSMATI